MNSVWLVDYDCGDYYCEGSHLVGVFATEDDAHAAVKIHDTHHLESYRSGYQKYEYHTYEWKLGEIDGVSDGVNYKPNPEDVIKRAALGVGVSIGYMHWLRSKYPQ